MLTKLRLKNFKNFQDAELHLGGFTLLLGTNAAGKSNICDALRILHGVAAQYSIPEVFGGRYENGSLQWKGIRGWLSEIAFQKETRFLLEATYVLDGAIPLNVDNAPLIVTYSIEINTGSNGSSGRIVAASIVSECIQVKGSTGEWLKASKSDNAVDQLELWFRGELLTMPDHSPYLSPNNHSVLTPFLRYLQDPDICHVKGSDRAMANILVKLLQDQMRSMRNFDWDPSTMRESVFPGYKMIGDRGEGLTSVLQSISQQSATKATILDWLQALTPMDAVDFEFVPEESGKIALRIIEANGQKISVASASDGTLRFLAFLASYFSAAENSLHFLEEIENGIHPTRLHLLLQLIEQQVKHQGIQTIVTTHSPEILRLLSESSVANASLIYRLDDRPNAQIQRIADIPHFEEIIENEDLGDLQESGWLEETMSFRRSEILAA